MTEDNNNNNNSLVEEEELIKITELIIDVSMDEDRLSSLFSFWDGGDKKELKRIAAARKSLDRDLTRHPRDYIKSEVLSGHMCSPIPNFKYDGDTFGCKLGLSYWIVAQKFTLENDEFIYSLTVSFYLNLLKNFYLCSNLILSSQETTNFDDLKRWVTNFGMELPVHPTIQIPYSATDVSDTLILETTEDYFTSQVQGWGGQFASI